MRAQLAPVREIRPRAIPAPLPVKIGHARDWQGERTTVEVRRRIADPRLTVIELGPAQLISMRTGEAIITRSRRDIGHAPRDRVLTFIFQVAGRLTFEHYGHCIVLDAGDVSLCDNGVPYTLHTEHGAEMILLRVPAKFANAYLPVANCFCGHRLGSDDGLASTATAMAIDLARRGQGALDADSRVRAAGFLLEVIASAYAATLADQLPGSPVRAGRLRTVKLYVEQHLRDPDLSPSIVAERLKVSDRYLRSVFAANRESMSSYIIRRRLEECARQLRDARWRGQSITEIAFSWGFNSAPHFARRFRERFNTSPSDYRHQHLDAAA